MAISPSLAAAIRSILLPIDPQYETGLFDKVEDYLADLGLDTDDAPSWISVQLRLWKQDGNPSTDFRTFVRKALYDGERDVPSAVFGVNDGAGKDEFENAGQAIATRYFEAHQRLTANLFSHDAARQMLSHTGLIGRLSIGERMSASEIGRLLTVKDSRLNVTWHHVSTVTNIIGCNASITLDEFKETFAVGEKSEPDILADMDMAEAFRFVADTASLFSCPEDFGDWLIDLFGEESHPPYLLILHFQLAILARFDHAVTYAYEFSPRGTLATWLTETYLASHITVAKSAFLNNAKALLRFDRAWVTGRSDNLRSANALALVLEQLENLSVAAKQALGEQIRALLHKNLRLTSERHAGVIPFEILGVTAEEANSLVTGIAAANTRTVGVLEQRLVDAFATSRHPRGDGWTERGVGDSVFAPNRFRKKFGDCEFQRINALPPCLSAYESHGGRLTKPYVDDHLNTLADVVEHRIEELEAVAAINDWEFRIFFIAHSFGPALPAERVVTSKAGRVFRFQLAYVSFAGAAEELSEAVNFVDLLQEHLTSPIHSHYVHPNVRRVALNLMGRAGAVVAVPPAA